MSCPIVQPAAENNEMETSQPRTDTTSSSNSNNSKTRSNHKRVLTPVVVCGSPCMLPQNTENPILSPLLTAAAAASATATPGSNISRQLSCASSGGTLPQNSVPASESEKLTGLNHYVLHELKASRPQAQNIEAVICPTPVKPFRKAWWAGVRPATCERTCRHRSKVCDAIQLCNDCTGYYCKWLADLVGIPVLKASGRVDPLVFHTDPLAKLYWDRISKVVCCPKSTNKCLMCIRRYQLFTHFLPGNLLFRSLVHHSVMKLNEEGFAVDMGLIRKVTRRHLERIAESMELRLPPEYYASLQAYEIILRRGPLVDVLANGFSTTLATSAASSACASTRSPSTLSGHSNNASNVPNFRTSSGNNGNSTNAVTPGSPFREPSRSPTIQHFPVAVSSVHSATLKDSPSLSINDFASFDKSNLLLPDSASTQYKTSLTLEHNSDTCSSTSALATPPATVSCGGSYQASTSSVHRPQRNNCFADTAAVSDSKEQVVTGNVIRSTNFAKHKTEDGAQDLRSIDVRRKSESDIGDVPLRVGASSSSDETLINLQWLSSLNSLVENGNCSSMLVPNCGRAQRKLLEQQASEGEQLLESGRCADPPITTKRNLRLRNNIKRPAYRGDGAIYYGDLEGDANFFSMLDDDEEKSNQPHEAESDDSENHLDIAQYEGNTRKKRRRSSARRSKQEKIDNVHGRSNRYGSDISFPGYGFENQLIKTMNGSRSRDVNDFSATFIELANQFPQLTHPESDSSKLLESDSILKSQLSAANMLNSIGSKDRLACGTSNTKNSYNNRQTSRSRIWFLDREPNHRSNNNRAAAFALENLTAASGELIHDNEETKMISENTVHQQLKNDMSGRRKVTSDSSPELFEQVASTFFKRLNGTNSASQCISSPSKENMSLARIDDMIHEEQLEEEARLGDAGVRDGDQWHQQNGMQSMSGLKVTHLSCENVRQELAGWVKANVDQISGCNGTLASRCAVQEKGNVISYEHPEDLALKYRESIFEHRGNQEEKESNHEFHNGDMPATIYRYHVDDRGHKAESIVNADDSNSHPKRLSVFTASAEESPARLVDLLGSLAKALGSSTATEETPSSTVMDHEAKHHRRPHLQQAPSTVPADVLQHDIFNWQPQGKGENEGVLPEKAIQDSLNLSLFGEDLLDTIHSRCMEQHKQEQANENDDSGVIKGGNGAPTPYLEGVMQ